MYDRFIIDMDTGAMGFVSGGRKAVERCDPFLISVFINSRRDCEKGLYSILRAKCAREIFCAPRHRNDPILDNADYMCPISGPYPFFVVTFSLRSRFTVNDIL